MENESLYKIVKKASGLVSLLIERGGDLDDAEFDQALDIEEAKLSAKTDAYAHVTDRLTLDIAYFKEQARAMSDIAKRIETAVDKLKQRLKESCDAFPDKEIRGYQFRYKLSTRKSKLILNEDKLDTDWLMEETKLVPNKEAIRDALEEGVEIRGAHLEPVKALNRYQINPALERKNGNTDGSTKKAGREKTGKSPRKKAATTPAKRGDS